MKKLILLSALVIFSISASAQLRTGNRPYTIISGSPGYITINEFNFGYGLAGTETEFSERFFGFTSTHGYQVNEIFVAGGGTGLLFYNDGLLIPLYLDMRMRFPMRNVTPYLAGAGGLLLNPSEFDTGTRMYINPSFGARYTINPQLAANLGLGLWMQMGSNIGRASLMNVKAGFVYKFLGR